MRNISIVELLTHNSARLFCGDFPSLDTALELEHLEERRIQLVLRVHLEEARVVEIQLLVLVLQVNLVLLLLSRLAKALPLGLARIHPAHQCLDFSSR
jgi:hypothetical protein